MHRVRCRGGENSKKLVRGPLAGGLAMAEHLFTAAMASLPSGCFYSTYDTDFFLFVCI